MADQPARLEAATVRAEVGSNIVYRFANDAASETGIPTLSGEIPNLSKIILTIQQEGADKISFSTRIYQTTAAGIAATSDQEIFLVQTDDPDEIYAVWQNVSGTAVDTGKRSLSAAAVIAATQAASDAATAAQESAGEATARVARFLAPSSVEPAQRDNGQPLEVGDQWPNSSNGLIYNWNGATWVPLNESVAGLEARLASSTGATAVGIDGKTLDARIKEQENWRTVEFFGEVSTPSLTKATMQAAINYCAANGLILRNKAMVYTVDLSSSSITYPDNFRCDFGGAVIRRATGNKTPHDMWVNADMVNGNKGISILNVTFDGQAQDDELTRENPAHRFCGLRAVKCEIEVAGVTANSTVNGEYQTEGTRGGIMLDNCVWADCSRIAANNNLGTGLFIDGGLGRVNGFRSANNTGSGMSGAHPNWTFRDLSSIVSGYSGISINGPGWTVDGVYASGAAAGFAGVNFGHATPATSNGTDAIANNVIAEDNFGWGINATSCPGIRGTGWASRRSANNNIRLVNCPGSSISLQSRDSQSNGVLIDGGYGHSICATVSGSKGSGVYVQGGAEVRITEDSLISDNGADFPDASAGVIAAAESKVKVYGRVVNGKSWGVQSTASSSVILSGARLSGNVSGPYRVATSGTVQFENVRLSDDPTEGFATILSGSTSVSVANGNIIDPNRVLFTPSNDAARALGTLRILSYDPGVSLVVSCASAPTTNAIFRYALL